jgi:hypothetical protein
MEKCMLLLHKLYSNHLKSSRTGLKGDLKLRIYKATINKKNTFLDKSLPNCDCQNIRKRLNLGLTIANKNLDSLLQFLHDR